MASLIPIAIKGGVTLAEIIAGALAVGAGTTAGASKLSGDGSRKIGTTTIDAGGNVRLGGGNGKPFVNNPTKVARGLRKGLEEMLSPRRNPIFEKGAKYGSMRDLINRIQNDPAAMKKYTDILLSGGKVFDPKGKTIKEVVDVISNGNSIESIIAADKEKYKKFLDLLKGYDPRYKIRPPKMMTDRYPELLQPDSPDDNGDPDDDTSGGKTKTKTGTGDEPQPDKPEPAKPDEPKKDKPDEDEPEKPKPPPVPTKKPKDDVKERPINTSIRRKMAKQQWYPKYQFGGQDLLRLTEVEKLEELKNYTLFDLVNPLLAGDEDNLLALQNKIQENRRFTNTYANPKPERPLPPVPDVEAWRNPFKSVYPVPYPMSLDQPQAQNYYDHFNNQDYRYLNKSTDRMAQGGLMDPDMQRVLNHKRDSFTATDKEVMKHQGSKLSLLEDIDSGSISQIDIMMLRQ